MRKSLFAAAAVAATLGLAASPGLAQSASGQGQASQQPQQQPQQQQQQMQGVRPVTQDQLRQQLTQAGFQDVRNLEGGMLAWEEAGLPVEK